MNILMIGHSRSGKTSYMAGLYNEFGDKAEGIGIWTSDKSKSKRLKKMADNIFHDIYPAGTDIASKYNFWLQINNSLIIPFNWYDYRGGALSESSKDSKDAKELISKITKADALIVFLDGEKIVSETTEDLEDDYDIILWAILKALSKKKAKTYFPVSLVITKGDLYSDYSPLYDSNGLEYFLPLINSIRESDVASGMISICEVASSGIYNVFSPLLFSLYYGMPSYITKRIESINKETEYYNNLYPNLVDDFVSGLLTFFGSNTESDRDKARKSIQKIEEEREQLEFLQSLSDDMKEALDSLVKNNQIVIF